MNKRFYGEKFEEEIEIKPTKELFIEDCEYYYMCIMYNQMNDDFGMAAADKKNCNHCKYNTKHKAETLLKDVDDER